MSIPEKHPDPDNEELAVQPDDPDVSYEEPVNDPGGDSDPGAAAGAEPGEEDVDGG